MKIAVEGCCHGELDKIYETIQYIQEQNGVKIDLLLCCGDFQAIRNYGDLQSMAVPSKYLKLNTFYKYYSGEAKAPVLTIYVGGNHEASNYHCELPYGGWVAPNIYYMGFASVVNFGGLRIAGISGIFKGHDYLKGHFEIPPFSEDAKRSAYHIRNLEIFRLKQISSPFDIVFSHEWPQGIYNEQYGDKERLLRFKKHLREDVENERLGCRALKEILMQQQPKYWFAAHLHVKYCRDFKMSQMYRHPYPAIVQHQDGSKTHFLALDKCLPRRDFLQVLDFPDEISSTSASPIFQYDREWLAVLKSTNHLWNLTPRTSYMPGKESSERFNFVPSHEELLKIDEIFKGNFTIPQNFVQSADPHSAADSKRASQTPLLCNSQTTHFANKLGVLDLPKEWMKIHNTNNAGSHAGVSNPEEILIFDEDERQADDEDVVESEESIKNQQGTAAVFSKLSLPPPKLQTNPSSFDLERKAESSKSEEESISVAAPVENETQAVNKEMKTFKRRNVAIYGSNDDDDEN